MSDTTKPHAQPDLTPYRRPEEGTNPPLLYPAYASTVLRAPKEPLVWLPQPGRREIILRSADGQVLDRVSFEVRGLQRVRRASDR